MEKFNSNNICIIINEASSTQTSFFSYNSARELNMIEGKEKLSIPHKMDNYAALNNAQGYYDILSNSIASHLINSDCSVFYWSLFATGGMRNLEANQGSELVNGFYNDIKNLFAENQEICINDTCKTVILNKAETISGSDEGYYAWLTIGQKKSITQHAVVDLGGQTAQFTNGSYAYSGYLGKERTMDEIGGEKLAFCFNDKGQYNGAQCRTNIKLHLETFEAELPSISEQTSKFFVVSNFYHYFNEVCNIYMPHIQQNDLDADQAVMLKMQNICQHKDDPEASLFLSVGSYIEFADTMCPHWGDWEGKVGIYARNACFSGNYNFQLLTALGMSSNQEIHADPADWALGAAIASNATYLQ